MGKWFTKYFAGVDYEVTGYDSEANSFGKNVIVSESLVGAILKADYVVLCTPTRRTPEIIRLIAKEMGLEFIIPDGAMYIFAKINEKGFDGVEFANNSLEKGLAVAPGEGFGNYKNFIRISACQDEKTLMEGMVILGNIMSDNQ